MSGLVLLIPSNGSPFSTLSGLLDADGYPAASSIVGLNDLLGSWFGRAATGSLVVEILNRDCRKNRLKFKRLCLPKYSK